MKRDLAMFLAYQIFHLQIQPLLSIKLLLKIIDLLKRKRRYNKIRFKDDQEKVH